MTKIFTSLLVLILLCSCQKKSEITPEEKQKQQEQQEPLKSNELLELYGLRFRVRTTITDSSIINVDLKLYKGAGTARSTNAIPLSKDGHMNYSILSNLMDNNCEYTLTIEYKKIDQNASYDLHTEGFTSIRANKEFLIAGRSFNTGDVGKSKDLMVVKKGILKFSVFELSQ